LSARFSALLTLLRANAAELTFVQAGAGAPVAAKPPSRKPANNRAMLLFHLLQDIDHRLVLLLQMMHDRLHFFLGHGFDQVVLLGRQAVFRRLPA
jgi:hypothetical protein